MSYFTIVYGQAAVALGQAATRLGDGWRGLATHFFVASGEAESRPTEGRSALYQPSTSSPSASSSRASSQSNSPGPSTNLLIQRTGHNSGDRPEIQGSQEQLEEHKARKDSPSKLKRESGSASSGGASAGSESVGPGRRESTLVDIERSWRLQHEGAELPLTTGNWEFMNFAEDYWTKKAKVSAGRLDAYRANLASSTNQLIQLIGLFIVFQGVLLTACVQSARLTCKYYKFPLILDIIATVCAGIGVGFKLKEISVFEELEDEFNQAHKHTESQLAELKYKLDKYDFKKDNPSLQGSRYTLIKFLKFLVVEIAIGGLAGVAMYLMQRVMCAKSPSPS